MKKEYEELKNLDFKKINVLLGKNLSISYNYPFDYFSPVIETINILIDKKMPDKRALKENIFDFATCESIIMNFFKKEFPNYVKQIEYLIREYPSNRFFLGTIEDLYNVLEFLILKLNTPDNQRSIINIFFQKTPLYTIGLLLNDYLQDLPEEIYQEESIKYWQNSQKLLKEKAEYLNLLSITFDLYQQNNHLINQEILEKYLNSLSEDNPLKNYIIFNLPSFLKNIDEFILQDLSQLFADPFNYIIACDLYYQIKENKTKLNNLYKLMFILGNSDFETAHDLKVLRSINFPLISANLTESDIPEYSQDSLHLIVNPSINSHFIEMNLKNYTRLSKSYEFVLEQIIEKNDKRNR